MSFDIIRFMKTQVYADNASTTKLCEEAYSAMLPYFKEDYENPSSTYSKGVSLRSDIERIREDLLIKIGGDRYVDSLIFTSGGAEADSLAVVGYAFANKEKGTHIITTEIEHHAVLNACKFLENNGYRVTYVRPSAYGVIDVKDIESAICEDTILVSVMAINNEIGSIQPIKEIGDLCKEKGIAFHTDAVQAFCKIPIDVKELNCDMLSVSAHKFHGPKGIGFLYIKKGIEINPLVFGGTQEKGLRGGTENVPAIIGMAKAAEVSLGNIESNYDKLALLKAHLFKLLNERLSGFSINGDEKSGYPGIANITIDNVEGQSLLISLDMKGVLASTGSACAIGLDEPSHVLKAIGRTDDEARSSLRLSFAADNTMEDIEYVVDSIFKSVEYLRKIRGIC